MKKNRIINKRKDIAIFLLLLISSMSIWFSDTAGNARFSLDFWRSLFDGNFFDFYNYTYESGISGRASMVGFGGYGIFQYFILALWNFPLYLIERIIGGDIFNYFFARVYTKLFFIILAFISGELTKRIALCCGLDNEKSEWCHVLFTGSAATFSSVAICGQVDITGMVFILLAVLAFLKDEKIKFYIWFALAVQCKFFALFIFIPLILIKEKNLIKIAIKVGYPLVITYILGLPFNDLALQILDSDISDSKKWLLDFTMNDFFEMKINYKGFDMPLLLILYAAICIYVYLINSNKVEKLHYVYYAYLGIASVLWMNIGNPYRTIYLVPFMVILLISEERNYDLRFTMFHIVMVSLTLGYIVKAYWCFDFVFLHDMLLDMLIPFRKFEIIGVMNLSEFLKSDGLYGIWILFYVVYIVYLIGFAVVHFPKGEGRKEYFIFNSDGNEYSASKREKNFWISLFANYLVNNIALILLIISVIRNIIYKFL